MDIKTVVKGLEKGLKYALPDWDRFYMFLEEGTIYIKSPNTEKIIYNLHISELKSNEWMEV
jgi:hypothetical protein